MEHLSSVLLLLVLAPLAFGELQVGFYNSTCPRAESIVQDAVRTLVSKDPSVTPALVRMYFHDCFAGGCDADILLIDSRHPIRGFEIIDELKEKLEAECPSVVSCADIIALATRDAVALAGGLYYTLPTGRLDALVVTDPRGPKSSLPPNLIDIPASIELFRKKGFSAEEMVILTGAHSFGVAHCNVLFRQRLVEGPLPLDDSLAEKIYNTCHDETINPTLFLDQNTSFLLDNVFFKQLLVSKGVLPIDQKLYFDNSTRGFVTAFASDDGKTSFLRKFSDTMAKLGSVEVLVGDQGNVRTKCGAINNKPPAAKKNLRKWMMGLIGKPTK